MPSIYMPQVVVEIAFDSGFTTPAVDRTWTDVSEYVELGDEINISRGRSDQLSEISPSQVSLTLDNRDGRFTPGRASSPYHPNVKVGRPIRVKVTPPGGVESVRFVGYVNEWPVEWDGTDAYAKASITASSRTARLGLNGTLRSAVEEEILLLEPIAYWALSEEEGAAYGSDESGQTDSRLVRLPTSGGAPAFGQPLVAEARTGAEVQTEGDPLISQPTSPLPSSGDFTVIWFMSSSFSEALFYSGFAQFGDIYLSKNSNDRIALGTKTTIGTDLSPGTWDVGSPVFDGMPRLFVLQWDDSTSTATLLSDLTVDASVTDATVSTGDLVLGNAPITATGVALGDYYRENATPATFAHVAVFDRLLTPIDLLWVSLNGRGFGETGLLSGFGQPDTILARYALWAKIPAAELDFDESDLNLAAIDPTGRSVIELMQLIADTDGGLVFDGRDGSLAYRSRDVRFSEPPTLTLSAAAQEIGAGFNPQMDSGVLLNDLTATNIGGTLSLRAVDQASIDEYGIYSESIELATNDADHLRQVAWWRVNTRSEPTLRTPALSVSLLDLDPGRQGDLLDCEISSRITVTGLPSQAPDTTADFFVEGYSERIGVETYEITFNVSDDVSWLGALELDSATRGVLDQNTLAF